MTNTDVEVLTAVFDFAYGPKTSGTQAQRYREFFVAVAKAYPDLRQWSDVLSEISPEYIADKVVPHRTKLIDNMHKRGREINKTFDRVFGPGVFHITPIRQKGWQLSVREDFLDGLQGKTPSEVGEFLNVWCLDKPKGIGGGSGAIYASDALRDISFQIRDTYRRNIGKGKALCASLDIRKVAVSVTVPENAQWAGIILNDFSQADPTVAWQITEWMNKEKLAKSLIDFLKSAKPGNKTHAVRAVWWTIDVIYAVNRDAAQDVWHAMSKQNVESIMEATGLRVICTPSGCRLTDGSFYLAFSWESLLRKGLSWVEYPPDGYGDRT